MENRSKIKNYHCTFSPIERIAALKEMLFQLRLKNNSEELSPSIITDFELARQLEDIEKSTCLILPTARIRGLLEKLRELFSRAIGGVFESSIIPVKKDIEQAIIRIEAILAESRFQYSGEKNEMSQTNCELKRNELLTQMIDELEVESLSEKVDVLDQALSILMNQEAQSEEKKFGLREFLKIRKENEQLRNKLGVLICMLHLTARDKRILSDEYFYEEKVKDREELMLLEEKIKQKNVVLVSDEDEKKIS